MQPRRRRSRKKLPPQIGLFERGTWGGRRPGAGRPRSKPTLVRHRTRPEHRRYRPCHVTLRLADGLPSIRQAKFNSIRQAVAHAHKDSFRICQISNQGNHIHCIVEADDKESLARGMQGFMVRLARAINRALGRRGKVFAERYHARALRRPKDVRNTLVYVLMNSRKHGVRAGALDSWSTARWFDGFRDRPPDATPSPVAAPRTWLLAAGWRKHGLLRISEQPGGSG